MKVRGFIGAVVIGGCLIVGILLAGCNSPATVVLATNESAAGPKASATAITTPELDISDPASWIITFDGVGPLTIGGSLTAEASLMTAFTRGSETCPAGAFSSTTAPSVWALVKTDNTSIDKLVVTGNADPARFVATTPKTIEGIGIGASLAQLTAAYPSIVRTGEYPAGEFDPNVIYFGVSNSSGRWIDFSIVNGLVESITIQASGIPDAEMCG